MIVKEIFIDFLIANALNNPPGKYDRKVETQRNWREFLQAVEHVI